MEEIWKYIKGYEGLYQVSNLGRIKSLKRNTTKGRILKPLLQNNGYYSVTLCKKGIKKVKSIHRLVCLEFLNNDFNFPQVNHKDGNKLNNNINNLEWCSAKYNTIHSLKNNLRKVKHGKEHKLSKKINQYSLNGKFIRSWDCISDVHREKGYNTGNICECCKKRLPSANGFIWRYKNENDN